MTIENLKIAKEIEEQIKRISRMKSGLERSENAFVEFENLSEVIRLTDEMKTVLLGMCIGTISRLEKEFDEL